RGSFRSRLELIPLEDLKTSPFALSRQPRFKATKRLPEHRISPSRVEDAIRREILCIGEKSAEFRLFRIQAEDPGFASPFLGGGIPAGIQHEMRQSAFQVGPKAALIRIESVEKRPFQNGPNEELL